MAELAVAGSAIGIISASIQVCQGLISYYDSWKGCHQDIANTADTIATFSGILKTVIAVLERQGDGRALFNKQIDDVVSQCKKHTDKLSMELAKFERYPQSAELRYRIQSHFRRLYYPFKEGTLAGLRDTVHDARSNLLSALATLQLDKSVNIEIDARGTKASLASQLDKLAILEKSSQGANGFLASQQNKMIELGKRTKDASTSLAAIGSDLLRRDIRDWLEAPDPSINQNVASKKCQEATGSWFVHGSQFSQWKERPNSFLWLHGFVGCGKTVLCSTIINNIHKHTASLAQSVLAFYYFDFSNQIKAQASSCLRSIVLQLAQRSSDITALEGLHRVYATGTPPTEELLGVLRHILQSFQRAYIVVDALDECTDQEELFDFLKTVRSWNMESLCVLVTSRDEPNIRNALNPERNQEVPLQNPAVDEDIALLIAETLDKDAKLQEWSDMFPEIKAKLTEGAKGMFRWVECQFQTLHGCPSRAEVRRALNDLPENLDKCYERILRRVPQKYCDYTLRVLQWLCIADESVRVDHVMAAFAANIGDNPHIDLDCQFNSSEKVLGLCPGFIITTNRIDYLTDPQKLLRPYFQIAHYSVKEYLLSNRIPPPPNPISMFKVDRGFANLAMAKTCLVFALHPTAGEFSLSAREIWRAFFRNAKEEPQLTALAIDYLTRKIKDVSLGYRYSNVMALATSEGLDPILFWLIEHHRTEINISDALFRVCRSNYRSVETVKFLVEQGAAVNELQYDRAYEKNSTPLHAAAGWQDVAVVQTLVQLGADPHGKDGFGMTPLSTAVQCDFGCPPLDIVKSLWCQDSWSLHDSDNQNLLYWVARLGDIGPRTEEVAWWLIHHGVNPHNRNNRGYTALHGAAEDGNESAIRLLLTATGRYAGYDGCLIVYLQSKWNRSLSIAQQLFAVDPRPLGDFRNGGGALSSFLLARYHQLDPRLLRLRFYGHEIDAILLKHEQDHSFTRTDVYVQFFDVFLKEFQPDDCEIANWLAVELKEKDSAFFGMELWKAAVGWFSNPSYPKEREAGGYTNNAAVDERLRVIRTLFTKREIFGVGITQLHRFLRQESRRGWEWFAETLVREEPTCVLANNNDAGQGFGHLSGRPLNHAAKQSLSNLFASMLSVGADPNEQDENGNTAIFFALQGVENDKIIQSLLELGCNIIHQNHMGLTPLAYTISRGFWWSVTRVLQLLLKNDCDMNIGDTAGRTPLMRAIARGEYESAAALLDEGCAINVQDNESGISHVEDIVSDCLDRQKRIQPCGGHTALMYAVFLGHADVIELLLQYGCDIDLQNKEGYTAIDLARLFHEDEIVEFLEDHESASWDTVSESDST